MTRSPGFLSALTPKPLPPPAPSLGQRRRRSREDPTIMLPKALTAAERRQQAKLAAHALCVDHVKVAGLREKVCIVRDRDADEAIAEAIELNHG